MGFSMQSFAWGCFVVFGGWWFVAFVLSFWVDVFGVDCVEFYGSAVAVAVELAGAVEVDPGDDVPGAVVVLCGVLVDASGDDGFGCGLVAGIIPLAGGVHGCFFICLRVFRGGVLMG
jgi:hypothetical protein